MKCFHIKNFLKTLEDQDKIYRAGNMLYRIAISEGGTQKLIELSQGKLNERDFPYVILSTIAFILIISYESNLNILKKTLTTMNLTNKKGELWDKEIENTSPIILLSMLRKYSKMPVTYIENMIFKNKELRNALSHGLFWYENERIFWVDNVNSPNSHPISFKKFMTDIIREQTIFAQCFLWVGGKLISEGFFEP